ncbi:hypothetical protein HYALB_00009666 [Hymenoscyphus albidus]|uniref:Uncharacterized protein n=1 Tax=Hymenoscyphus albidus TaxID=595503 RepID=A0A9N9LEI8_9HELO|nr:hypothetical protein HYALB_00009666 [Hymenoscyphus albidus]
MAIMSSVPEHHYMLDSVAATNDTAPASLGDSEWACSLQSILICRCLDLAVPPNLFTHRHQLLNYWHASSTRIYITKPYGFLSQSQQAQNSYRVDCRQYKAWILLALAYQQNLYRHSTRKSVRYGWLALQLLRAEHFK